MAGRRSGIVVTHEQTGGMRKTGIARPLADGADAPYRKPAPTSGTLSDPYRKPGAGATAEGGGARAERQRRVRADAPPGMHRDQRGVLHYDRPVRAEQPQMQMQQAPIMDPGQKAELLARVFGQGQAGAPAQFPGFTVPATSDTTDSAGVADAIVRHLLLRRMPMQAGGGRNQGLMPILGNMLGGQQAPGVVGSMDAIHAVGGRMRGIPTAAYQGYLQALQERRDARAGVPLVPPQGAASPSAQRRTPGGGPGKPGRSY